MPHPANHINLFDLFCGSCHTFVTDASSSKDKLSSRIWGSSSIVKVTAWPTLLKQLMGLFAANSERLKG